MNEGRRADVPASEIADTIEAVFAYLQVTQRRNRPLLQAIRHEAAGWRDQISGLRGANQETVDAFFGQPPKDIEDALAVVGITPATTTEDRYSDRFDQAASARQTDGSAYSPGKVVLTLSAYATILKFDAYREALDGIELGPAARLVRRLDAFQGASGSKHLAGTGLMSLIHRYIGATPRHPSEVYTEPPGVQVGWLNAFQHTYSTHVNWKPSDDLSQVTTDLHRGWGAQNKFGTLAFEKAKVEAALRRGGIEATVGVRLGKTYGDDAIHVVMSMDDFTGRYLPILRGEMYIDTTMPDNRWGTAPLSTVERYRGYEPGKVAFAQGSDLLISSDALADLQALAATDPSAAAAVKELKFLRSTHSVSETTESVPMGAGRTELFVRLTPASAFPRFGDQVTLQGGRYYSSTDMHSAINRSLRNIQAVATGATPEVTGSRRERSHDRQSFVHNGDVYMPRGQEYYQLALHMQYKYGTGYTLVISDETAKVRASGQDKYVVRTSALEPETQSAAIAELESALGDVARSLVIRDQIENHARWNPEVRVAFERLAVDFASQPANARALDRALGRGGGQAEKSPPDRVLAALASDPGIRARFATFAGRVHKVRARDAAVLADASGTGLDQILAPVRSTIAQRGTGKVGIVAS